MDDGVSSSALPSGLASLSVITPIWPAAPGLFSTTMLVAYWPRSRSAVRRASTSMVPPGGKPEMMRASSSGAWAWAKGAMATEPTAPAASCVKVRRLIMVVFSSWQTSAGLRKLYERIKY
jgi:hypothetical protein